MNQLIIVGAITILAFGATYMFLRRASTRRRLPR